MRRWRVSDVRFDAQRNVSVGGNVNLAGIEVGLELDRGGGSERITPDS